MDNIYFYSIGIICFFIAVTVTVSRTKLLLTGERVTGIVAEKVVRNKSGPGTAGSKCARITYRSTDGECKYFIDQNNIMSGLYRENQEIKILIDIKNKNRIVVNSFFALYSPCIFLFAFSAAGFYMTTT